MVDVSAVVGTIDLRCGVSTTEGQFLARLYYETNVMGLFQGDERMGSPHNGGRHELNLEMPHEDLEAFLQLIEEKYGKENGCTEFLTLARSRMH